MFNKAKQPVFVALFLMGFLLLGAVGAEARDYKDTKGADRLVKGAIIGAAAGAVVQQVRGRTQGKELLKGAAVGAAAGAAVGAYSDYRQERNAREDDRYYRHGRGRYDRGRYDRGRYDRGRYDDRFGHARPVGRRW